MKHTPGLGHIVLVLALLVMLAQACERRPPVWDEHLMPPGCVRQYYNPWRHRERWTRRQAQRARRQREARRVLHRRCRVRLLRQMLQTRPGAAAGAAGRAWPRAGSLPPWACERRRRVEPSPGPTDIASGSSSEPVAPDPLADLRQARGWVDHVPERELWAMLIRVRWPHGPHCPHCGERDRRYLKVFDADYRGGLGRWQCQVCAQAGDPGQAGTFTPLTGTLLDGERLEVRTLWLIVEAFASARASLDTADEARVNRHTTDRLFRLLRAALYQARSSEPLVMNPGGVAECDEVYLTAGLKGHAGGLALDRPARRRGLKRRGRGTWDSDRLPVFGVLCRGGQVRLFVLRNVRTETIRPLVQQLIRRGARVYTDSYAIYHFLARAGYRHAVVNHGAGEYARDADGDGHGEVHCNTLECTWSWLRPMIRTYRGMSKVYLPLYVAHFEFLFNRRQASRWSRALDVLQVAFQVDRTEVTDLLQRVDAAQFAEVCPIAG